MRFALAAVSLSLAAPATAFCQYLASDVPNDVVLSQGGAVPQQQWVGDTMQFYEPGSALSDPNPTCSGSAFTYYCGPTNAMSITKPPDGTHPPGVWGHDEGPSVQFVAPSTDSRALFLWGDSVTAYNVAGITPDAYQVFSCDGGAGDDGTCLGVDTVSIVLGADLANTHLCTYLQDLDAYLLGSALTPPSYSGAPGHGGTCPAPAYIVDTVNGNGTTVPWAGFTYQHVTGLLPGEDMLLGHTPTGAFALAYTANDDSDLFVVYNVMSQKPTDGLNYETDAVLLYENDANSADVSVNPHPVSKTQMPNLTRAYSFSALPNGTVYIAAHTRNAYPCTGSTFDPNWVSTALWQGLIMAGTVYPVTYVKSDLSYLTLGGTSTLPGTGTSCSGTTVSYAAIPVQGTGPGRFLFAAPEVLSASLIAQRGWSGGLPANLRGAAVVCFWGSDWEYRKSNLYLGCMAADRMTIESATNGGTGVSAMYYLTGLDGNGNTTWLQGDETQSAGMLSSWKHGSGSMPCIGEHSVRWIAALGRFLLTYGSAECGGLRYRTAAAPWGPWTSEALLFSNDPSGGWMQKLIYPPF